MEQSFAKTWSIPQLEHIPFMYHRGLNAHFISGIERFAFWKEENLYRINFKISGLDHWNVTPIKCLGSLFRKINEEEKKLLEPHMELLLKIYND